MKPDRLFDAKLEELGWALQSSISEPTSQRIVLIKNGLQLEYDASRDGISHTVRFGNKAYPVADVLRILGISAPVGEDEFWTVEKHFALVRNAVRSIRFRRLFFKVRAERHRQEERVTNDALIAAGLKRSSFKDLIDIIAKSLLVRKQA